METVQAPGGETPARTAWQRVRARLVPWVDDPRRARWLVFVAIGAGTALRLVGAPDAPFGWDLATSYLQAKGIASGTSLPVVGAIASWGGNVPLPGYFYLVSIPLLFSDSVVLFMLWGALLCSLALPLFARLLWERYGPRAAVFGSWLGATSPWLVINGDSPWSPKVAVPAVMLLFYALHRVVAHERSRWAAAIPLALCLQAHIYPNVPITLLATAAILLVSRPRVSWTWFVAGAVAAALTTLPSVLHLATHGLEALGGWGRVRHHRPLKELVDAGYHSIAFATPDVSYEIAHGTWTSYDLFRWFRSLPRSLEWTFGFPRGVYVGVACVVVWACWIGAFARGCCSLVRRPLRALDPMAIGLVVCVLGSLLLVVATRRPYLPRYNTVIAFMALLPIVWAVVHPSRLAIVLWLGWAFAIPANVDLVRYYYRIGVPPHGARTMVRVIRRISREQGDRPFQLVYRWDPARTAVDRMGRELVGARWRAVPRAAVKYIVLPGKLEANHRSYLRRRQVESWRLGRARLLRVPSTLPVPFAVRYPSSWRPPAPATRTLPDS